MTGIVVELLHVDGCPNALEYLPQLRRLAATAGVDAPVTARLITDAEQAHDEAFLGSPTVRVNGHDVDPSAATRTDYGLSCRLYPGPDGLRGTPPDAWVIALLCPGHPHRTADPAGPRMSAIDHATLRRLIDAAGDGWRRCRWPRTSRHRSSVSSWTWTGGRR